METYNRVQEQQYWTQELETAEELLMRLRIEALPEGLQRLAIQHHLDQFLACPSYIEQQAQRFVAEEI